MASLSRSWLIAHLSFLVILIGCFSPVWMQGKLLAPMDILGEMMLPWRGDTTVPEVHNHFVSDAITQYIPYRWFAHQSLREDGYVGWNNLNYCGTPQYANTMATSFDWTIQLHRWMGFWQAWHVGIFLQFWIAGAGMMVFLRSQGISPLVGLLGAICFAGNFQFIAWIYHRWALGSFCWMPWVLWSVVPLSVMDWRSRGVLFEIPRRAFLGPAFLVLAFFGGTLQHAAFVVIAVACIGIAAAWGHLKKPGAAIKALSAFAVVGLLGVGMAWVMFQPSIEAFRVHQAATGRAEGFGYPGGLLQPIFNLLAYPLFAFPWPMGSPNTLDVWKFFKIDLFYLPYIGLVPMGFAVAGIFSRRVPLSAKLLMLAGFGLPLTPLVAPLYHRVFLVGILGAVWAACCVLDGITPGQIQKYSKKLALLFVAAVGIWFLAGMVIVYAKPAILEVLQGMIRKSVYPGNFATFPDWFLGRGGKYLELLLPWSFPSIVPLLLAACGVVLILTFANRRIGNLGFVLGIVLVAGLELLVMAQRWVTFSPRDSSPAADHQESKSLYLASPMIQTLQSIGPGLRLYTDPSNPYQVPFPPNTLATYGIAALRGYDSIKENLMVGVGAPTENSPELESLAVTHALVQSPLSSPKWELVESSDGLHLYRLANPDGWISIDGKTHSPGWIGNPTQNRREFVIPAGTRSVRISENWDEGWFYRSEGGPWENLVRNADGSLGIAFQKPTDAEMTISMQFLPWKADHSSIISIAFLVAYLGLVTCVVVVRRRQSDGMRPFFNHG